LVSQGKKTCDTGIVGIAAIPKTIPKAIPNFIRNEKNEKTYRADKKTIPKWPRYRDTIFIRNGLSFAYSQARSASVILFLGSSM
jgi:hypothetical protein